MTKYSPRNWRTLSRKACRSAGPVRPPLQNLAEQDLADLNALIATVS